ncbi:MAG TPA: hypothetical protein VII92_19850, partial [Anaerolineae bacterium]
EIDANAIGSSELASTASAEIVDDNWNELQSGHTIAGSFGKYLDTESSGLIIAGLTLDDIADKVWNTLTTGHTNPGTFGEQLKTDVDLILTTVTDADTFDQMYAGSDLETDVTSKASQTSVDGIPTVAEFDARTLLAEDYATDTDLDALVTTVGAAGAGLTSLASQTSVDGIPTVAEFDARTLLAEDYFDPATDNVSVSTLIQAALAQFVTDDTGETTAAANTVAALSGGSAQIDQQDVADALKLAPSGGSPAGTSAMALLNSASTATNVTDAKNDILTELGNITVTGVADFTAEQQLQILAALSVTGDIGVPKALVWTVQRIDGQVGSRFPVVIDPDDDVEVAVKFNAVLGMGDAIETIVDISLVDSDAFDDVESPAFADVSEADIWMASAVKFRLSGGTNGKEDQIKVRVETVGGNTINAIVRARPQD